jgi:hypothetical protein
MKFISATIKHDKAYLIPIGDIHLGDKAFGKAGRAKLAGYLDWVAKTPNARVFLMGDVFNVAGRGTKTSPFESSASEYDQAHGLFEPVRSQILGVIDGNHEARMIDMFGYSPLQAFCARLGVPYCGWSAVLELKVGRNRTNAYYCYMHHTTGGGGSLGGALNRSLKLQDIVQGVDVYCGGHNHQLVTGVKSVYRPDPAGQRVVARKITYVDCGSYLDYENSYAEKGMYPPGKLGSPKLSFKGYVATSNKTRSENHDTSHDVHVSL